MRCCHCMSLFACTKTGRSFLGRGLCHGSLFSFSCEAGSSLSVLSELGHLCLAFFLQTTHSGNLFAVFVALLWKWNEASASQMANLQYQFQEHVSIIHGYKDAHVYLPVTMCWANGTPWKSVWFVRAVLLELTGGRSLGPCIDLTPAELGHAGRNLFLAVWRAET